MGINKTLTTDLDMNFTSQMNKENTDMSFGTADSWCVLIVYESDQTRTTITYHPHRQRFRDNQSGTYLSQQQSISKQWNWK